MTDVNKIYRNSIKALDNINLNIKEGEIFSLLGPNGAGKSTLINSICGVVNFNSGTIKINGYDNIKEYRKARQITGIVPQELYLESFETVWKNINYSRGLFGKPKNHKYVEDLLKMLSLWDKKDSKIKELSGGMKRRVLIAKALSHQPKLLFLDEPTASIDVELRKETWDIVRKLNKNGTTIVLTTHYIEEAEELSSRVAIINDGKIILVNETDKLIKKLGEKSIRIELKKETNNLNSNLKNKYNLEVNKNFLTFKYNIKEDNINLTEMLNEIENNGYQIKDFITEQSSLEEIFIKLIKEDKKS
ncbi:ABC transporter ATP-binding protein [Pelagibacteraceae bacterium]|nr:ABC transporter ATP-binding protein [Pelagibacteraceae bacterium]